MNQVATILRRAKRSNKKLNILTFPTHERYESFMCRTGHQFYSWRGPGIKEWVTTFAPVPENYVLLNPQKGDYQIPPYVDIDMVLSQNKGAHYRIAQKIATNLGVPLIQMEHTLPPPNWTDSQIMMARELQGDIDVFVSEWNRDEWGYPDDHGFINYTGIDTDVFKPVEVQKDKDFVLSVVNDWINRDWCCGFNLWAETVGYPDQPKLPVGVIGETKGFSKPAKSIQELVESYNKATVYLNTTLISSFPTVILEAMACGLPVVSTGTCLIPKVMIQHGHNGFVSMDNNPDELRNYCIRLLKDKDLAQKMGENGRRTVEEKFGLEGFVQRWDNVFQEAINYRR
jgi:hypothetical protein